jgi:CMP-N,N'-diacetyllegionaminic acid synthase
MTILAFVPARGGSKSIKNKNMTKLHGKPLIKYTLDILKKLNKNIKPFISTDSKNIRPKNLSSSKSNVIDAIFDAVKWLKKEKNYDIKTILLLEPTNPIRNINEISKAINYFRKNKIKSLASVCKLKHHPFESIEIKKNNWKFLRKPNKKIYQRQQFTDNFYFIDGNFYIVDINFLKKNKTIVKERYTKIFKIKRSYPIDINTKDDLKIVSNLIK